MKGLLAAVAVVLLATSIPALAQTPSHDHEHGALASTSAAAATMVGAEVRKVDKDQGKMTLSHEPIPNLEMPKMTMVFRVKDVAFLDQVKAGERVKFAADRIDGQLTVVALEPVK